MEDMKEKIHKLKMISDSLIYVLETSFNKDDDIAEIMTVIATTLRSVIISREIIKVNEFLGVLCSSILYGIERKNE